MTASLAGLLPLSVLEPDGLIVTTEGRYVRMIECERVPNALTADPVTLGAIERAYANVCRAIPDHQGIVVYAQTDPVPLKEALEVDLELTRRPPRPTALRVITRLRTLASGCSKRRPRPCSPQLAPSSPLSRRAGGSRSRTRHGWRARETSCAGSRPDPGAGRCGRRIARRRSRARA